MIKADPTELGNHLPGFNSKDYKAMPHPYTWARIAAARLSGAKTLPYTRAVKISKDNGTLKVVTAGQEILSGVKKPSLDKYRVTRFF